MNTQAQNEKQNKFWLKKFKAYAQIQLILCDLNKSYEDAKFWKWYLSVDRSQGYKKNSFKSYNEKY